MMYKCNEIVSHMLLALNIVDEFLNGTKKTKMSSDETLATSPFCYTYIILKILTLAQAQGRY